jgi:2-polyprenyl-6-methoxyphenol hydroxylase-like FAD-dependent oxidoreductase
MYPIGSNGASQAILDARALSDAMQANPGDVSAGFARYESERLPATAAIVRANRGNGPEQVMQLAEERAPQGFEDIEKVVPLTERKAIAAKYKQVAGFSKEALAAAANRAG